MTRILIAATILALGFVSSTASARPHVGRYERHACFDTGGMETVSMITVSVKEIETPPITPGHAGYECGRVDRKAVKNGATTWTVEVQDGSTTTIHTLPIRYDRPSELLVGSTTIRVYLIF